MRIAAEYAGNGRSEDDGSADLLELGQLTPHELFSRAWEQAYGNVVDEQTLADFALLLQDVQQEEEQP
ncbi:hypothetical protein D3C81_523240 [compost metagenome]